MSTPRYGAPPYPSRPAEVKEIVLIRHAQSQGNVDGMWHGRTDGPLSVAGEESLEYLGRRLSTWEFDVVYSSPLERARKTAGAVSEDVLIEPDLIEMNVGSWEGRTFEAVERDSADELRASFEDWSVPMGGSGESLNDLAKRAYGVLDRILDSLGNDQRAVVVTHGGFLQPVLHRHLAGKGRPIHPITANTGITRIRWQHGRPRLVTWNDTGHLGPRPSWVDHHMGNGTPVLALVRHGRTKANVEQRWQGHGDWDLDEVGHRQAEALGDWYGPHPTVYSSPLRRAMSTAKRVASDQIIPVDGLKEMDMGEWEGLTSEEIMRRYPDDMATIYENGVDLPRGRTGENWSELAARVGRTITELSPSEQEPTVVVAHGGAIRSYLGSLTDTTDTHSESLFTPANTSISHVALTGDGPVILDYSVATHLEGIEQE
jgi:broad specificity phosphatase PhoE